MKCYIATIFLLCSATLFCSTPKKGKRVPLSIINIVFEPKTTPHTLEPVSPRSEKPKKRKRRPAQQEAFLTPRNGHIIINGVSTELQN